MDYDKAKKIIIAAFVIILALTLCNVAGRIAGKKAGYKQGYADGFADGYAAPHPADTLVVTDTIRVEKPVPQVVYIDREKPVYLPVHDTALVVIRDTTYIAVEREIKTYSGEDYKLEISGVYPSLDWIEVYARTEYITPAPEKRKPRLGFGLAAGPGAVWNPQDGVRFGVGAVAGLSLTF